MSEHKQTPWLLMTVLCLRLFGSMAEEEEGGTQVPLTTANYVSSTTMPTSTTTLPPPLNMNCFHQPDDFCDVIKKDTTNPCACKKMEHYPEAVGCCNVDNYLLIEGLACAGVGPTDEVQALHIRNATLDSLNLANSSWKRLKSLAVTDGKINRAINCFPKWTSISCLNLSNNGLNEIEPRFLVNLTNLTTLDLSHNNLESLPNFDSRSTNITLDISENKPLNCSKLQEAMKTKKELIFQHQNDTFCLSSTSFHWFNTTEHIPFSQMEHIIELEELCPKIDNQNCTCTAHRLDLVPGKPPTFAVKVDCSNRNLTKLPKYLPPSTIVLNVSYNHISSLSFLSDEPSYQHIRELYADNNEITSISKLEGTKFIDNFAMLSLRENKIRSLPTYFLSNTFDRNWNSRFVKLGLNRLHCDCNTVKILKLWLLTKQKNIPDYDELLCENLPHRVMDLDQRLVCQFKRDWTDYIYYIIACEILLLLGLVCKVSYDYWVFKTAGYLPWPANKMPKMPCDWLCET